MKKALCLLLALLLPLTAVAERGLSAQAPQVLTLWHYYNGAQQQVFDRLVREFNETVGLEKGIIISPMSQGSVDDLADKVLAAAQGKAGADKMPDIFAAYADSAFAVDQLGLVADVSAYMTEAELAQFMDAYIEEGRLGTATGLKVFPVAKSTEIMLVNKTEWDAFAADTGAQVSQLATWEGVAEVSRQYYEWSGGKAFFGRDAFANYVLIGSKQLGAEVFCVEDGKLTLNIDEKIMRRLWDNYVVPYAQGWFGAYGRYRSDDVKTGQLAALVGSTSGAMYFPTQVTRDDGTTYPIEAMVLPLPNFEGTQPYAAQQGAGMVVTRSTENKEYAAVLFLKWFTGTEQDLAFSLSSGYLPVGKTASQPEMLEQALDQAGISGMMREIISGGAEITRDYHLFANSAFANSVEARRLVENSMPDAAKTAREQYLYQISNGQTPEDAIAHATGDAVFEQWLAQFRREMEAIVR